MPDIAWTKNGGRLPSQDRHILLPSGTLRVVRASTNDRGQYECRAINVIGVVLARALLTVKPRGMCNLLVVSSLHRPGPALFRRQEPINRTLHLPHCTLESSLELLYFKNESQGTSYAITVNEPMKKDL